MSFTETLSDDHASANRAGRTGKSLGQQLVEIIRKRNEQRYRVVHREDYEQTEDGRADTAWLSKNRTILIIDTYNGLGIVEAYTQSAISVAFRSAEELNATDGF